MAYIYIHVILRCDVFNNGLLPIHFDAFFPKKTSATNVSNTVCASPSEFIIFLGGDSWTNMLRKSPETTTRITTQIFFPSLKGPPKKCRRDVQQKTSHFYFGGFSRVDQF